MCLVCCDFSTLSLATSEPPRRQSRVSGQNGFSSGKNALSRNIRAFLEHAARFWIVHQALALVSRDRPATTILSTGDSTP